MEQDFKVGDVVSLRTATSVDMTMAALMRRDSVRSDVDLLSASFGV